MTKSAPPSTGSRPALATHPHVRTPSPPPFHLSRADPPRLSGEFTLTSSPPLLCAGFAPTIKESRVAVKIDGLCDFADAEDPPAPCCRRAPPCRPPPGRLLPPARPSCGGS
jgi:hypothetical protein